jgi:hypothetical protein
MYMYIYTYIYIYIYVCIYTVCYGIPYIFMCTYTLVIVLTLLIITGEVGEIDQAQELMLRVESLQAAKEEIVVSMYEYIQIDIIKAFNFCICMHIHAYISCKRRNCG